MILRGNPTGMCSQDGVWELDERGRFFNLKSKNQRYNGYL